MADLSGVVDAIIARGEVLAADAIERVVSVTADAAPVASGATRDSVTSNALGSGALISYEVVATTPQALWTDQGSPGGQIIVPTSAKALRFEAGGETVFARRVVRGTIPAQHWFTEPAQARWTNALQESRQ